MTQNNQLPIMRLIAQSINMINGSVGWKMSILVDIGFLTLYIEMDFPIKDVLCKYIF